MAILNGSEPRALAKVLAEALNRSELTKSRWIPAAFLIFAPPAGGWENPVGLLDIGRALC
jgi:hypothetical protein